MYKYLQIYQMAESSNDELEANEELSALLWSRGSYFSDRWKEQQMPLPLHDHANTFLEWSRALLFSEGKLVAVPTMPEHIGTEVHELGGVYLLWIKDLKFSQICSNFREVRKNAEKAWSKGSLHSMAIEQSSNENHQQQPSAVKVLPYDDSEEGAAREELSGEVRQMASEASWGEDWENVDWEGFLAGPDIEDGSNVDETLPLAGYKDSD